MRHVVIDPGHGGSDVIGRSTPFGERIGIRWEKDQNLDLAMRVARELGNDAVLTRDRDHNVALGDRAAFARASRARAFVSVHGRSHAGADVFVHPRAARESRALADVIYRALGGRSVVTLGELAVLDPEYVGRDTAACLVECGPAVDAGAIARALRGERFGQRATITAYPSDTTINITDPGTLSDHHISVSSAGDLSLSGQVTLTGTPRDPRLVIQVSSDRALAYQETFTLERDLPMLFGRTIALPTPGRYRIVFYMYDLDQPPPLSVTGSFSV